VRRKAHVDSLSFGCGSRLHNHAQVGVAAADPRRTGLDAQQCQRAIATSDVEYAASLQRPGKAEDDPPLQRLGDLAEGRVVPGGIDLWSELASAMDHPGIGQAFESVMVITTCPVADACANPSCSASKIESTAPTT